MLVLLVTCCTIQTGTRTVSASDILVSSDIFIAFTAITATTTTTCIFIVTLPPDSVDECIMFRGYLSGTFDCSSGQILLTRYFLSTLKILNIH